MARLLADPADEANPLRRQLHVGFAAPSREHVDAFWRAGTEAGYVGDRAARARHGSLRRGGKVEHIWIRVADLAVAKRFYETIALAAGLRLDRDTPARVQVEGASGSFSLLGGEPTENVHIAFPTDDDGDVRRFHEAATGAGYRSKGRRANAPDMSI